jgi:hypothetical protein
MGAGGRCRLGNFVYSVARNRDTGRLVAANDRTNGAHNTARLENLNWLQAV